MVSYGKAPIIISILDKQTKPISYDDILSELVRLGVNSNYKNHHVFKATITNKLRELIDLRIVKVNGVYHAKRRGRRSRLYSLNTTRLDKNLIISKLYKKMIGDIQIVC